MSKHIYKGQGAPSFTPPQVSHHYVDLLNRRAYISIGTSSPSDWIIVTASGFSNLKAGRVLNSSFTGSPKKATVTFSTSLATAYAVNITGVDTRVWTVESQTSSGFVINSNANLGLTGDVFWEVQQNGEF